MFQKSPNKALFQLGERPAWAEAAPITMCFTPEAMQEVVNTVGARPPETGAKGFSPVDHIGFEIVEFDVRGSQAASGSVYAPDSAWGDERCAYWMGQPDERMRLWSGDIHSHPGLAGIPSPATGRGLGDLGYVAEVFDQNEVHQHFLMPIVTRVGTDKPPILSPWVLERNDPSRPLWANVRICRVEQFPTRQFNPDWERSQNNTRPFDVRRLAGLCDGEVLETGAAGDGLHLVLNTSQAALEVYVPSQFPAVKPHILVLSKAGKVPVRFKWLSGNANRDPESILAAALDEILIVLTAQSRSEE